MNMKMTRMIAMMMMMMMASPVQAALTVAPQNQDELLRLLRALAEDHPQKVWCDSDCAQIHVLKVSGTIASGKLKVEISGAVMGRRVGVVPLFGSVPALELSSLKSGAEDVPLFFYNKVYHTFLPPGPFVLVGEILLSSKAAVNVTLPGAVGKVVLDIPDQEPRLAKIPRGQVGGSFQIVPLVKADAGKKDKPVETLRLAITRRFNIGRDKTFFYSVSVAGAKPGQVISIPLEHKEKVLQINPVTGQINPEKVDFTAPAADAVFEVEGEWTEEKIELVGPSGAVQETWEMTCEGAFDCSFAGDVETRSGGESHQWSPMPGQKLAATWKELAVWPGQSMVAQSVQLANERLGKGIKQTLTLNLTSSAVDQMIIKLPDKAVPTSLKYGSTTADVLTTKPGEVHLSIPQGNQNVTLTWEITEWNNVRMPLPVVNVPTGTWTFTFSPSPGTSIIHAGGLPGSPVVLFWPRLAFCLLAALFYLAAEKRILGTGQTGAFGLVVLCAGFALIEPALLLVPLAFLAMVRWLERVQVQRTFVGRFFESFVVLGLTGFVVLTTIHILDTSFFTSRPFEIHSFCNSGTSYSYDNSACWKLALADPKAMIASPYALTVPVLGVRVAYFIWALLAGATLYREFLRLGRGYLRYWKMGARPLVARKVPLPPAPVPPQP